MCAPEIRHFGPKGKAKAAAAAKPKAASKSNAAMSETPAKAAPVQQEAIQELGHRNLTISYDLDNSLKVKLKLPSLGYTWFFIKPHHTIGDFEKMVQAEDKNINRIDFVNADGSHTDNDQIIMDLKEKVVLEMDNSQLDADGNIVGLGERLHKYQFNLSNPVS